MAEAHLIQPTFITEYPAEVSPLARRNDINPEITDRFEFFIGGREIGNGFSELNDAEDPAQRFLDQVAAKDAGDDEAMFYDEDYVTALEHGLPPTAGLGIGIDRMVMLFTTEPYHPRRYSVPGDASGKISITLCSQPRQMSGFFNCAARKQTTIFLLHYWLPASPSTD